MRNLTFLALTMLWFAGCGGKEPAAPAAPPRPVVNVPPLTPPPAPPAPVASPVPLAPIAPPPTVLKKAEKGVGDKGRGYGEGMVATPVAAYFAARERIAFDIQVPQALNLFKGEEGRAPASQEEFMEKIIKANQIKLPTLPEGHRYRYDPKTEQLMVEQPP